MKSRILVIDDEAAIRDSLRMILEYEGYEFLGAASGQDGLAMVERENPDLVFLDIKMPGMDGLEVLQRIKAANEAVPVVMISGHATVTTAVDATKLGALDFIEKPLASERVLVTIRNALDRTRLADENRSLKRVMEVRHQIVGDSPQLKKVMDAIRRAAPTNATVLIGGESGVGKELVARAIHVRSPRSDRPFVAVNCGALTETLLDSELFGHMRGAFTGADGNRKGLIEVAEKGTIFLDEIGEMSPMLQVKVLRVLQERKFRRVGGTEEIEADIRIIAATNRDLAKMVAEGQFREDLYYRINVIPVRLPSLRERTEDIPLLAAHFVAKFAEQMKKPIVGLSGAALECLKGHSWPGNVRELENAIERAVALERTPSILPESLPEAVRGVQRPVTAPGTPPEALVAPTARVLPEKGFDLEKHVQHLEREYIADALRQSGGVKVKAAELLGMSFRSFRYYMKKYNLK